MSEIIYFTITTGALVIYGLILFSLCASLDDIDGD